MLRIAIIVIGTFFGWAGHISIYFKVHILVHEGSYWKYKKARKGDAHAVSRMYGRIHAAGIRACPRRQKTQLEEHREVLPGVRAFHAGIEMNAISALR